MTQQSFDFGPPPEAPERPEAVRSRADWAPPDQVERDRIAAELDANLLVEAGAGSGKTTAMVGRIVELVRAGREVDRIAAVTFTRKAAAELRERSQEALEKAYRDAVETGDEQGAARFGAALDTIDRSFLGTIHSFCARLIRERPLEAGVPPDFDEVSGPDEDRVRAESWTGFLERLSGRDGSRLARALAEHGLRPVQLRDTFREIADNPDVRFPAPPAPPLDPGEVTAARRRLETLLDEAERLMPSEEPARGYDDLQKKVRGLRFRRRVGGWDRELDFLLALERALDGSNKVVQKRWADDRPTRQAVRALGERWDGFCHEDGRAQRLLRAWWALRYRAAIRFARAAAAAYRDDRIRAGKLTFQDLLMRTAHLLRGHAGARAELGERYRWLLVDEFQDTDPVQAEILLLLASDPAADPAPDAHGRPLWQRVEPRPGALFVVGDPKQSIYRFRRADIAVYNRVKDRFREFGHLLRLVTNFRSRRPVETLVNRVFAGPFPGTETETQAAFAPLRVRPDVSAPTEGIYWYRVDTGARRPSNDLLAESECGPLVSWIRDRVERGERRPGDFMILTMHTHQLATYARALEAHSIPVQVSGAKVNVERELSELIKLLRALADPDDGVLTLAVLEGLFFGMSHEDLFTYVQAGGRPSFTRPSGAPAGPVADALATLNDFWRMSRRAPADVAVARIVERLGILPWAAAGDLGSTRAGAIVFVLDTLRVAAREGAASLAEAIEILTAAREQEVDAPLVPGEADAVRVMNLHKAKGLEAPVVVLAHPRSKGEHAIHRHIARNAAGEAVGWLRVSAATRNRQTIARPADWSDHEAAERPFQEAEEVRKLYVAATRAAEELVVARCDPTADTSCWADLHGALDSPDLATELTLRATPPPVPDTLDESAGTILARVDRVEAARQELAEPTYRARPVTSRVHGDGPGRLTGDLDLAGLPAVELLYLTDGEHRPPDAPPSQPRGREWGSAVHRALEVALRGADGEVLRSLCRDALVEFERPADPTTGEPEELDELVSLVLAMRRQPVWERVRTARNVLVEAPFSVALPRDEAAALGIEDPAGTEILDGTIDLAIQDQGGRWTVVDFKTDARQDPERDRIYRRQVTLYALALRAAGGTTGGVGDPGARAPTQPVG
jgi:ATP-dependent helicase/nuclease subunit A